MSCFLYEHESFLNHETPLGHPETADRIRALSAAFSAPEFSNLVRKSANMGELDDVILAHPESYIDRIREIIPEVGTVHLDSDTVMSPGTWEAALRGLGAATSAVEAVMSGQAKNAFCAIRPPGHHAEKDTAMGFCLFNNIAIAARSAQKKFGVERVAIYDFDVHHGNGTQDIFWDDPSVLYCSTHQYPLFPGTGSENEEGQFKNIVNATLVAGDDGVQLQAALDNRIIPAIEKFKPDLILLSAGFDAHRLDPLAQINLEASDFQSITKQFLDLANKYCEDRVVSLLEGGYSLEGLALSASAHVQELMEATG